MKSQNPFLKRLQELGNRWIIFKSKGIRFLILLLLVILLFAQFYPPLQVYISSQKYILYSIGIAMLYTLYDAIVSPPPESKIDHSVIAKHFTDMRSFLQNAFTQSVIEIDIAAYSGETFYNLMTEFLQNVKDGIIRPNRLHFRMIVPDCSAPMFVPCAVGSLQENLDYKKSIQERNKRFANEFAHYFSDIRKRFPEIDLRLSIRMHKFSPLFKMININSQVVFMGFYPIAETPVNISGDLIEVWDFRGERTVMVGLPVVGNKGEAELAREVSEWFESVWKNLTEIVVEVKNER